MAESNGVPTKPALRGRGEVKTQTEFSACGKCSVVTCTSTKRVAAVDKIEDQRKPEDFIGHRNRTACAAISKRGEFQSLMHFFEINCINTIATVIFYHLNNFKPILFKNFNMCNIC